MSAEFHCKQRQEIGSNSRGLHVCMTSRFVGLFPSHVNCLTTARLSWRLSKLLHLPESRKVQRLEMPFRCDKAPYKNRLLLSLFSCKSLCKHLGVSLGVNLKESLPRPCLYIGMLLGVAGQFFKYSKFDHPICKL